MTAKVIPIVEQRAASRGPVIPAPTFRRLAELNSSLCTSAHAANLAPMPTLEINATQPWHIAQPGNVAEITRLLAVMNPALRGTLLPKLLSGELSVAAAEEVVHHPERQTV